MQNVVTELQDALAGVQAALDAVNAASPVQPDAVRVAVEGVLTSEGWTAPVPAEVETPAEDASPEDTAEV